MEPEDFSRMVEYLTTAHSPKTSEEQWHIVSDAQFCVKKNSGNEYRT